MRQDDRQNGAPHGVAQDVRSHDRDRYMTALFAPPERRAHLLALYAFNLELARIAEVVSEPMIGEIRLQWWREAIAGIYEGSPREHPVVHALDRAVRAAELPRQALERLVDARSADLEEAPFETMDQLVAYAEESSAPLMELAVHVLTAGATVEVVRDAASAWALSGILRAVPFMAAQGRVLLPKTLLRDAGIDPHDLLHGRMTVETAKVVALVHEIAAARADRVRGADCPRGAVPALLPVVLARSDLKAIRKAGYNPFDARLTVNRPGRILTLVWHGVRRRL